MRSSLALFFLFIFFSGCTRDKVPAGVLAEGKMIEVLTDVHLADGYTSTLDSYNDSTKIVQLYKAVYKKHGIDSMQFKKSLEYYSKSPKKLQLMYKQIDEQLVKLQKSEEKREQQRLKDEQRKEKLRLELLKKKEKLKRDSLKRDSLKKITLKRDSLKRDSVKKAELKKEERKRNDIPAKRNR
ncbi:DUF4296 domain-containing protein [Pedobacter sp. SYSU D00535]|uniref:DUF4296 domain-containing protein n=1 Tax=Pedobacter sp. SYSU D00535 TaxID=2810308 RepID=UPI001A9590E0|nr:DUF4296 domain-containing protein [Pedobacter sp. SYSU D00535]